MAEANRKRLCCEPAYRITLGPKGGAGWHRPQKKATFILTEV